MPLYNANQAVNISMVGTAGSPSHDTIKIYTNIFTLSGTFNSATGYSLDISSANFTAVTSVQLSPISNSSTLAVIPIVSEKSRSTSAIVVNILTVNSTTITALLQTATGLAFATSLVGMSIDVRIEGY